MSVSAPTVSAIVCICVVWRSYLCCVCVVVCRACAVRSRWHWLRMLHMCCTGATIGAFGGAPTLPVWSVSGSGGANLQRARATDQGKLMHSNRASDTSAIVHKLGVGGRLVVCGQGKEAVAGGLPLSCTKLKLSLAHHSPMHLIPLPLASPPAPGTSQGVTLAIKWCERARATTTSKFMQSEQQRQKNIKEKEDLKVYTIICVHCGERCTTNHACNGIYC